METNIHSDTSNKPSICRTASTEEVSRPSSFDQQVMDQFSQIKTMFTSLFGRRQEATRTAFCNYLASEVENLEERDCWTFRNEDVKVLNGIQSRAQEGTHQPFLQHHFYLCATDLSAAASSLCHRICLAYSRNPADSKSGLTNQANKAHTTSQDSSILEIIQSVIRYFQMDRPLNH